MPDITIRELIEKVKADLLSKKEQDTPLFVIDRVSIEISFIAEKQREGGISLKILNWGLSGSQTSQHTDTQKIIVDLLPLISPDEIQKQAEKTLSETDKRIIQDGVTRSGQEDNDIKTLYV